MECEFQNYLDQLTSFIGFSFIGLKGQPLSWSRILIVEDTNITYGGVNTVSRFALTTPDKYSARFEEHLNAGHSWINLNAASVIGDTLLVVIELPRYANTIPREKVSVNLSGPTAHTLGNFQIIS